MKKEEGSPVGTCDPRGASRYVFPPELVALLREKLEPVHSCLVGVDDDALVDLLTVAFFASLETDEGQWRAIRIVFAGAGRLGPVSAPGGEAQQSFHWNAFRFESPRAFTPEELLKLASATRGERMYLEVVCREGELSVVGLARESFELEGDRFLKVVVSRPGGLSLRVGRERILEYEGGSVVEGGERFFTAAGPVREALEASARAAGLAGETAGYLEIVSTLALGMVEHGRGGILVVSHEESPKLPSRAPYRLCPPPILEARRTLESEATAGLRWAASRMANVPHSSEALRNALRGEGDRALRELAALTAMDGAAVLSRGLAIVGFGIVLPIEGDARVLEAQDAGAEGLLPFDLGARGTRHRAAASYASNHPESVVLIAPQGGGIGCMLRRASWAHVVLFRFGQRGVRRR